MRVLSGEKTERKTCYPDTIHYYSETSIIFDNNRKICVNIVHAIFSNFFSIFEKKKSYLNILENKSSNESNRRYSLSIVVSYLQL